MTNYFRISKYKVGYFSFYLPMVIAKIMVNGDTVCLKIDRCLEFPFLAIFDIDSNQADEGSPDSDELSLIEEISLEMGHLFQVQDDFLDCFGNPDVTGKHGTTIKGNRCSWFAVRTLQKVDCYQEKLFKVVIILKH